MFWSSSKRQSNVLIRALAGLVMLAVLFSSLLPASFVVAQDTPNTDTVRPEPAPSVAAPDAVPEPPRGWSNGSLPAASPALVQSLGWNKIPEGFGDVRWLVVLGNSPNFVFASIDGVGLFISQDAGVSWTPMSTTGLTDRSIQAFAVCPSGKIFAGTWGGGVFRHDPQTKQWTQVNNGLTQGYISAVSCDGQNTALVGAYDQGVFRSTDDGLTWTPANSGIRPGANERKTLTLFVVPGIVGLGTVNGAYVSYDGGKTWRPAGLDGYAVYDFAYDRSGSNEIWAATNTGGVFSTTNGGQTWIPLGGPASIYTVAQGPDLALYAGTRDSGLYRYENGQWALDGLAEAGRKTYIVRSAAYNRLLAGTNDGLWAAITIPRTPTPTPTSTPTATSTPAEPRVVLSMWSLPDGPISEGDQVSYYVDYQVLGDSIASNVVITNAIPSNVELAAGSVLPADKASVDGRIISWSLGNLPTGASGMVSYKALAPVPTATPTVTSSVDTQASPMEKPTPTGTPLAALASPGIYLPLPVEQNGVEAGASGAVTVINSGAYAYWSFGGAQYQSRSGSVVNGQVKRLYLPLISR